MKKLIALLIAFYCLMTIKAQQDSPSNNGAGGYISSGNFGGTGNAAYFPAGIWSNSANNWIYGNIHFQYGFLMDVAGKWRIEPSGHSFFNGGNFGIGTTAPLYKLDIDNAKYGSGQIRWRANGGGTSIYGFTYADQSGVGITNSDPYSELLYLNASDHSVSFYSAGQHRFIVTNNGNVGIGTSNPEKKLQINCENSEAGIRIHSLNNDNNTNTPYLLLTGGYKTNNGVAIRGVGDQTYGRKAIVFYSGWEPAIFDDNPQLSNLFERMRISSNGNVLIGKSSQTPAEQKFKLDVAGPIRANEIVVNTTGADFVFEPTYKLRTLSELEAFIKEHKHLPEIASASEMEENGVSMGEMQTKLLQKQEETLLYLIEQSKQIEALKKENEMLLKRIEQLENTTESKAK